MGSRSRLPLSPRIDVSAPRQRPTRHFMEALIKFRCSFVCTWMIIGFNVFTDKFVKRKEKRRCTVDKWRKRGDGKGILTAPEGLLREDGSIHMMK